MPRLVHGPTGSVVNVSDETAATLPSEYQPVKPAATKAAPKHDKK